MKYFADIHCHPSLKAYGHSFPGKENNINPNEKSSIWYYDPPNIFEKFIDLLGGIVKYRQSSLSSNGFGNVGIVFASLYPLERSFFDNKLGTGEINDLLLNFVTSVGSERIDFIQSLTNYFPDLENEYAYIKQLDGKIVTLADRATYHYSLASKAADLQNIFNADTINDHKTNSIAVILTIEGAHSFGTGIHPQENPADRIKILTNVETVKNWEHRPIFITLAHHFYNELCGHAESLTGIVKSKVDQSYMINTGFTPLGFEVVDKLLDNSEGKRILIDIKHMSRASRLEYFNLLDTKYQGQDIPVIVSHGAVIGNEQDKHLFVNADINLYDDEIVRVARTNGLFGLQLDERRIADHEDPELKKSHGLERRKVLFHSSFLVWRQIQHIAELLDAQGLFAWGIQSIGSDYDGMIDPINGFWTAENLPTLEDYLLMHAHNYMQKNIGNLIHSFNHIDPEEIVDRIMGNNAFSFVMKYYH